MQSFSTEAITVRHQGSSHKILIYWIMHMCEAILPCKSQHPTTESHLHSSENIAHTSLWGSLVNRSTPFAFLFPLWNSNCKFIHGIWNQFIHQHPSVGDLFVIPPCWFSFLSITDTVLPRNNRQRKTLINHNPQKSQDQPFKLAHNHSHPLGRLEIKDVEHTWSTGKKYAVIGHNNWDTILFPCIQSP